MAAAGERPGGALRALVEFHVDFALDDPTLSACRTATCGSRDADARQVRRLQRRYVELWVEVAAPGCTRRYDGRRGRGRTPSSG